MLRKITFLLLTLSTLMFLGCSQDNSPTPSNKAPLVVGMSVNYPPIAYKVGDKPAGLEADFAYALAKELNRKVTIKILPWNQLPMALESGLVDIVMAGVSITKKRLKYALFSEPYMQISQMAVIREGDSAPNTIRKGRGDKIGYIFSTTGETFVKNTFPQASHKGFTSDKQGIAAVMNKEIDYFFHDAPSIWYYTAELSLKGVMGWYVPYTKEHIAWAFSPRNRVLRDDVNKVLERWRQNGKLSQMIQKWIRVQVITPNGQKPISFE
jgi:polar amino acid transport system substrate-binding protein